MKVNCGVTPEKITELAPNELFVFGSNLQGIHGKGAAKLAMKWGAEWGVAIGRRGHTYALPTKRTWRSKLPLEEIQVHVDNLIEDIMDVPIRRFLITKIGCGYAGYTPEQIAPMFKQALRLSNCTLPQDFIDILTKD